MKEKDPSTPTEPQLNEETKKQKSEAILNALLIGFLIGIIIWSVAVNTVGFLTLIPLYLIYRLIKKPKEGKAPLEQPKQ